MRHATSTSWCVAKRPAVSSMSCAGLRPSLSKATPCWFIWPSARRWRMASRSAPATPLRDPPIWRWPTTRSRSSCASLPGGADLRVFVGGLVRARPLPQIHRGQLERYGRQRRLPVDDAGEVPRQVVHERREAIVGFRHGKHGFGVDVDEQVERIDCARIAIARLDAANPFHRNLAHAKAARQHHDDAGLAIEADCRPPCEALPQPGPYGAVRRLGIHKRWAHAARVRRVIGRKSVGFSGGSPPVGILGGSLHQETPPCANFLSPFPWPWPRPPPLPAPLSRLSPTSTSSVTPAPGTRSPACPCGSSASAPATLPPITRQGRTAPSPYTTRASRRKARRLPAMASRVGPMPTAGPSWKYGSLRHGFRGCRWSGRITGSSRSTTTTAGR